MLQGQFISLVHEEPMSTLPQAKDKNTNSSRQMNLRLFTGNKPHQQQVAQKLSNSQGCTDSFNPPPILSQKSISFSRNILQSLSKDDIINKNIESSSSTNETVITLIQSDEVGESCISNQETPINYSDALEARIHQWLDDQKVYITDPKEKRDKYYQKLKIISQIQSSVYLNNEDVKTNATISDNLESYNNLTNFMSLTTSTIPHIASIQDISTQLNLQKIENSPLLLRRGIKDNQKERDEQIPVSLKSLNNCFQAKSPQNQKQGKKQSIFRASEPNIKKETTIQMIDTVPFTFDELEEDEKKNSGSIQELNSLCIDMHNSMTAVSDSLFNQKN